MSNYFKNDDLSFIPFTNEQEIELFKLAATDLEARNKIITNYLQFAAHEGLSEARGEFPEDEVLSAANEGLIAAVGHFDYKKGNRFSCFARRFIRGRVGNLRKIRTRRSREVLIGLGTGESRDLCPNDSQVVDHEVEDKDWQEFWIAHVKKFIKTLPHNEQIAVNVIIFEEGDFKQLAARLNITTHNARRTYMRAIESLKKLVKKVQP